MKPRSKVFVGLDPGKNGGIAYVDDHCERVYRMPSTERDIADLLGVHADNSMVLIERVHSMPKQGVKSMFTFGRGYGFLRGCLVAYGIPFEEVRPQVWQKEFGLLRKTKQEIKEKAQNLFPGVELTLATSDALLIAEYCRRKFQIREDENV